MDISSDKLLRLHTGRRAHDYEKSISREKLKLLNFSFNIIVLYGIVLCSTKQCQKDELLKQNLIIHNKKASIV